MANKGGRQFSSADRTSSSWQASLIKLVLILIIYAGLAAWSTWPTVRFFHSALPSGDSPRGTVPMLNAWTVWWNAEALQQGMVEYWNAPIFYPAEGTFAFSEPQPATLLVAPLVWLAGPIAAYNCYLLLTLTLNGYFARRLLIQLRLERTLASLGGAAMVLHPLVHQSIETLQLSAIWGVIWTFDSWLRFHQSPSWKKGAMCGVAFAATTYCCVHHALFLGLVLLFSAWTLLSGRFRPNLTGALAGGITCVVLTAPVLLPMHSILREYAFSRNPATVAALSAEFSDWLPFFHRPDRQAFLLGPVRVLLLLGGIVVFARSSGGRTRGLIFLGLATLISLFFSMGMNIGWREWSLWETARQLFSPLAMVRSPYRFAFITQALIIVLAFWALGAIKSRLLRTQLATAARGRRFIRVATLIAGLLVAVEVVPSRPLLYMTPLVGPRPAWIEFIATHTPSGSGILCLPVAKDASEASLQQASIWMMYATQHRQQILNGYSGFFPQEWLQLREKLARGDMSAQTMRDLRAAQVHFIVVRRDRVAPSIMEQLAELEGFARVFVDGAFEVWEFQREPF